MENKIKKFPIIYEKRKEEREKERRKEEGYVKKERKEKLIQVNLDGGYC